MTTPEGVDGRLAPWWEAEASAAGASSVASASRGDRLPLFTVTDLLLLLYLYPLRLLSAFIPRDVLHFLGRATEPFLQFHSREWRRMATTRMLAAPSSGITPDQAPRIARQLISNALYRLLDDLVLSQPSFPTALCGNEIQGLDHLERAQSAGAGVLVLSGHFYANRLARRYLAAIGRSMLTVRDRQPSHDLAGRLGRRIVHPRLGKFLHGIIRDEVCVQDPECTLKILQRLRSGGLVNIHLDASYGARTIEGRLLGVPRRFSGGVFDIIRLSGCAVVPMLCLGRSTGFRIIFGPPLDVIDAPARDEFIATNLPSFVQTLEEQIVSHPQDWALWMRL